MLYSGVIATLEFFEHHFLKLGHRDFLCLDNTENECCRPTLHAKRLPLGFVQVGLAPVNLQFGCHSSAGESSEEFRPYDDAPI